MRSPRDQLPLTKTFPKSVSSAMHRLARGIAGLQAALECLALDRTQQRKIQMIIKTQEEKIKKLNELIDSTLPKIEEIHRKSGYTSYRRRAYGSFGSRGR